MKIKPQMNAETNRLGRDAKSAVTASAKAFSVAPYKLHTPLRTERVSLARFAAYAILFGQGHHASDIAAVFNRERTTVLYGLRKLRDLEHDRLVKPKIAWLRAKGFSI